MLTSEHSRAGERGHPPIRLARRARAGRKITDDAGLSLSSLPIVASVAFAVPLLLGSRSLDVTLIGSGRVVVYRDGKRIVGRWQRSAPGDVTRYYDAAGREIPLGPGGPTWVELVPQNLAVDDDGP